MLMAAALSAPTALAQPDFTIGSIIRGFELPVRNAEGILQFKVSGEKAIVISINRIEIQTLKIDVYEKDQVAAYVSAPSSDFWKKEGRLTTSSGVEMKWPNITITSKSMDWDLQQSKGILTGNVKVVIANPSKKNLTPNPDKQTATNGNSP